MLESPWLILDIALVGAAASLAACLLADAIRRKDAPMLAIALACVCLGLRHGVILLIAVNALPTTMGEALARALVVVAVLLLFRGFRASFPTRFLRMLWTPLWVGLMPGVLAALLGLHVPWVVRTVTVLDAAAITVVALAGLHALAESVVEGHVGARRMLAFYTVAMVLLLVHGSSAWLFHVELPLSGLALLIFGGALGVGRMWAASRDLLGDLMALLEEIQAWRAFLRGPTWRPGESSDLLTHRLGEHWFTHSGQRFQAPDGTRYLFHRAVLSTGSQIGWAEVEATPRLEGEHAFLRGWLVGLGVDEEEIHERLWTWLTSWGASVTHVATVPPREGPYPSLMIWIREPSILAVWRENDLARRRCRWVQLGGARIEGPHLHLPRDVDRQTLMEGLMTLISLKAE